jgi:cell division septum initiation protein DivIVA
MKREDLEKLGLTDKAQVDAIMDLHGKDIEGFKSQATTNKTQIDTLTAQLTEASKRIEGFKGMDIEGVKKAADEWKTKAEQAEQNAAKQLAEVKFNHALETALAGAKAKNPKAVQALLSKDALKYNDADGSIVGLKEQLEKIKTDNDYLFADDQPAPPKVVAGANPKPVAMDAFEAAMWKGAGIKPE